MNKKRLLMTVLALFMLTVLHVNVTGVSATPTSPYIAVDPQNQRAQPGLNFEISIKTDYSGNDVYLWHVQLTFNATLLQCTGVANGDLITEDKDPSAIFDSEIKNDVGEVSAGACFFYQSPDIPFTTNGPGTLVDITFTGTALGNSSLTLGKDTKLQIWNYVKNEPETKIEPDLTPHQIGHGATLIAIPGDANGDGFVDIFDISKVIYHRSGPPPGPGGYSFAVDQNGDGVIDIFDISVVLANRGHHYP